MLYDTSTLIERVLPVGKNDEAAPLYRRALNIPERVLIEQDRDTADSLDNLAGLLKAQGAPYVCCDVSMPTSACSRIQCC